MERILLEPVEETVLEWSGAHERLSANRLIKDEVQQIGRDVGKVVLPIRAPAVVAGVVLIVVALAGAEIYLLATDTSDSRGRQVASKVGQLDR